MSANSISNKKIIDLLKSGLMRTCRDIFADYFALAVTESDDIDSVSGCDGAQSPICSLITFTCADIRGTISLITGKELSVHIVRSMGLDVLSDEEETDMVTDAIAELLNIITGNASEYLQEHGLDFEIGTPQTASYESINIRIDGDRSWIMRNSTEKGWFCLVMDGSEKRY